MEQKNGSRLNYEHYLNLVFQQIFNYPMISRAEIARNLNLNKARTSSLYNKLYERGYIKEVGRGESTEFGGRKPIMLTVNEKYGYIISFDIAFHQLHVMSNYIDGTVIDYKQIDTESDDIHAILPLIDQQINDSMQNNKTKKGLLAICFSIHGVVYKNQIKDSPFINMKNVDLYERYSELYSVPVVLENEANLAAIYERDFNDGREKKSYLY